MPGNDQTQSPGDQAESAADYRTGKYKIEVDRDKCIGAASCVGLAPGTFQLDEENKAIIIGQTDTPDNVLLAAQSCPTKAIILVDEQGNQVWPK